MINFPGRFNNQAREKAEYSSSLLIFRVEYSSAFRGRIFEPCGCTCSTDIISPVSLSAAEKVQEGIGNNISSKNFTQDKMSLVVSSAYIVRPVQRRAQCMRAVFVIEFATIDRLNESAATCGPGHGSVRCAFHKKEQRVIMQDQFMINLRWLYVVYTIF
jgi:hypothetical protein